MFTAEINQEFSPRGAHRLPGGILVAGNRVQERDPGAGECFFQLVNIKTVLIHRHADDVQTVIGENLKGQEIAGLLYDDGVARLRQMGANKIQSL